MECWHKFTNPLAVAFAWGALAILFFIFQDVKFNGNGDVKMPALKLGSNFRKPTSALDPVKINTLEEYELIENLYGRLVEFDEHQELVVDLAHSFHWEGNNLTFIFNEQSQTIDGRTITAEDAYISLKRAMFLGGTGHGDLRELLCPGYTLKSMTDPCPGIHLQQNKLVLTPATKELAPFILPFLASGDFSIIPKEAIDLNSTTLPIISYRITSGPYYVKQDDKNGQWELAANRNSKKYSDKMPLSIQLVTSDLEDPIQALFTHKIDIIPTFLHINWHKSNAFKSQALANYNLYSSLPIKVTLICFTPQAMTNFSREQRLFTAQVLANEFKHRIAGPGSVETVQYFQGVSDGSLSEQEKILLSNMRDNAKRVEFKIPIQFSSSSAYYQTTRHNLLSYPEIEVVDNKVSAYLMPLDARKDTFSISTDSAWSENLAMLNYNIKGGFMLPDHNMKNWLKDYIATSDRRQRLDKLRKWHFELLNQVVIYPVLANPYFALVRKPWQANFLTYTADTQLWRMRQEQ